jgi:hypothetical protein
MLPGAPYLHGMLVRSADGAIIVGRFNPAPVVLATAMFAFLTAAIWLVSFGTDSSKFWRTAAEGLTGPAGTAILAGVAGIAAVSIYRVFTWERDCADIAALLNQCCQVDKAGLTTVEA